MASAPATTLHRGIASLLASLLIAGCRNDQGSRPTRGPTERLATRLIDSIAFETEDVSGTLHRVEVRAAGRTDTVPGVLTEDTAALVGDSLVVGFLYSESGDLTNAFAYHLRARELDTLPIPPNLRNGFSDPAVSPDGRHLAYVAVDDSGHASGVTRVWPNGLVVARTPALTIFPGDVQIGAAEWSDASHPVLYIDAFSDGSNRWVRFRGDLRTRAWIVDTITAKAPTS